MMLERTTIIHAPVQMHMHFHVAWPLAKRIVSSWAPLGAVVMRMDYWSVPSMALGITLVFRLMVMSFLLMVMLLAYHAQVMESSI